MKLNNVKQRPLSAFYYLILNAAAILTMPVKAATDFIIYKLSDTSWLACDFSERLKKCMPFLSLFIIFTMTLCLLPGCGSGKQALAILSSVTGSVSVFGTGSNDPVAGQAGLKLKTGDIIKAGDDASATITFFEGSTVEIKPGTVMEITDISQTRSGTFTILMEQTLGETISRVNKLTDLKSRYEIETVAATAAVRGSTMVVIVASSGLTSVGNEEGTISVIAQDVEVPVPEGEHSTVIPGEAPGAPQPGSRPVIISTPVFYDGIGDLFDADSAVVTGKEYLDIASSRISRTGSFYTARMVLNGPCPVRTEEDNTFIEWDILIDADNTAATGTLWPLIGNDIGYDYLVRVGLYGDEYRGEILATSNSQWMDIEFLVAIYNYEETGNILELYFPAEIIGSPESFNWIAAVRQYLDPEQASRPSASDKSPDEGHYTFP